MKPYQFALIAIGMTGFIAWERGWFVPSKPIEVNTSQVQTAEEAGRKYLTMLADDFARAARGAINDQPSDQQHAELTESNRAARKQSFADVDEILESVKNAPGEKRAEVYNSISSGLRQAAGRK